MWNISQENNVTKIWPVVETFVWDEEGMSQDAPFDSDQAFINRRKYYEGFFDDAAALIIYKKHLLRLNWMILEKDVLSEFLKQIDDNSAVRIENIEIESEWNWEWNWITKLEKIIEEIPKWKSISFSATNKNERLQWW